MGRPRSLTAVLASLTVVFGLLIGVAPEASAAPKLTNAAMRAAPVPAMCYQKAGRLKNGSLPGVKGFGYVKLKKVVFGQLTGDSRSDAAAVLECAAGNAPFPHVIGIYTPDSKGRAVAKGYYRISTGHLPGYVSKITISKKAVTARWLESSSNECSACATVSAQARIRVVGGKVKTDRLTRYRVTDFAKAVSSAVNSKTHSRVVAVSRTKSLASYMEKSRRQYGLLKYKRCTTDQYAQQSYICFFTQKNGVPFSIKVHYFGWKNWKVVGRWYEV